MVSTDNILLPPPSFLLQGDGEGRRLKLFKKNCKGSPKELKDFEDEKRVKQQVFFLGILRDNSHCL